jgi:hypothetical protein
LRAQPPAALDAIEQAVTAAVMRYRESEVFALPMPFVLAAGRKT